MISKLSKPILSSFFKAQRGYYKILRNNNISGEAIPIYTANRFDSLKETDDVSSFVNAVYNNKPVHERYLKLVPFFVEAVSGRHKKQYVIRMGLLEKAESLKITCMTNSAVTTKFASLSNIIPVIYTDFVHDNRRKMFEMPLFLDTEMIYYNLLDQEFYVFDTEGKWHEEGVNHPLLDLTARYDERKFYDTLKIA